MYTTKIYFIDFILFDLFNSIFAICFSLIYFLASVHSRSIHQRSPPFDELSTFSVMSNNLSEAKSKAASAATMAAAARSALASASVAAAAADSASDWACAAVKKKIKEKENKELIL